MASFNRVILAGNLTRDPQLSYLPSSTAVAEFGLAINRRFRTQDGQQRDETCFIDCRCYGRQGETINQYVSKGRPLLVEGRLQYQNWTGQDGTKKSKHIVIVESFTFIDGRRDGDGGGGGGGGGRRASAPEPNMGQPETGAAAPPADTDIPF